jgi:cytochrome c553
MQLFRLLAPLACVLVLAGCGGGTSADSSSGAKVFAQAGCGGCHTLKAAGATGKQGPDLDQLRPGVAQVKRQVERGGGGMPSFDSKLTDDEIQAVADYVASSTGGTGTAVQSVAGSFKPDDTKLSTCNGDFRCMEQAFGNLAYYKGPKVALERFERDIAKPGPIEGDCHRIAHAIGAASLARLHGAVGQAFAAGSAACWSGYYHGVLERAFVGVSEKDLGAASRRFCADPKLRNGPTFILYQCVHGLGHGLMIYTGYDLPKSLHVCDELADSWDRTSCTGGVFMENLSSSYGVTSRWLRNDDLIYPCDVVAPRHKIYCYLMVTSRILPKVDYDFAKAAKLCRRSERGWVATCFQSLGRDASGHTRQNPTEILKLCGYAGDMMSDCVYGAARDMTSNYAGGREASVLCSRSPNGLRARCFEGIGTILGSLYAAQPARRNACKAITQRYRAACFRGAGA